MAPPTNELPSGILVKMTQKFGPDKYMNEVYKAHKRISVFDKSSIFKGLGGEEDYWQEKKVDFDQDRPGTESSVNFTDEEEGKPYTAASLMNRSVAQAATAPKPRLSRSMSYYRRQVEAGNVDLADLEKKILLGAAAGAMMTLDTDMPVNLNVNEMSHHHHHLCPIKGKQIAAKTFVKNRILYHGPKTYHEEILRPPLVKLFTETSKARKRAELQKREDQKKLEDAAREAREKKNENPDSSEMEEEELKDVIVIVDDDGEEEVLNEDEDLGGERDTSGTGSDISITHKISNLREELVIKPSLKEKYKNMRKIPRFEKCVDRTQGNPECLPPGDLVRKQVNISKLWGIKENVALPKAQFILLSRKIMEAPFNEYIILTYARPVNHPDFNPYSLKVVKFKDVASSTYLTLSKYGVILFSKGYAEFTSLYDYERQMHIFDRLRKLHFFKKYKLWKAFYQWHYNVRHVKLKAIKEKLEETLFVTRRPLRKMLGELLKLCEKISSMRFVTVKPNATYALKDFTVQQEHRLDDILVRLRQFEAMALDMTYAACRTCLIESGFSPDEYKEERKYAGKSSEQPIELTRFLPSHIYDYPGQWLSFSQCTRKKRLCAKLTHFIHLIDFHIQQAYNSLLNNSIISFLCDLDERIKLNVEVDESVPPPKHGPLLDSLKHYNLTNGGTNETINPTKPLFEIGVSWSPDVDAIEAMTFNPSTLLFQNEIKHLFGAWKKAIMTYPNLLPNEAFNPFTQPILNGHLEEKGCGQGPSMEFLLSTNKNMPIVKEVVDLIFYYAVNSCSHYADTFSHIRDFCLQNEKIKIEDIERETDVRVFTMLLERFHSEMEIIKNVEDENCVGIFKVTNSLMRANAYPSVTKYIEAINEALPSYGAKCVAVLHEKMMEFLSIVKSDPKTDNEKKLRHEILEEIHEKEMDNIEKELDMVSEIYDLIGLYEIPGNEDELNALSSLHPVLVQLKLLVESELLKKAQGEGGQSEASAKKNVELQFATSRAIDELNIKPTREEIEEIRDTDEELGEAFLDSHRKMSVRKRLASMDVERHMHKDELAEEIASFIGEAAGFEGEDAGEEYDQSNSDYSDDDISTIVF